MGDNAVLYDEISFTEHEFIENVLQSFCVSTEEHRILEKLGGITIVLNNVISSLHNM